MLETNELIPILKCFAPCQYCMEGESGKSIDKNFCTQCWQDTPFKYLMTPKPWDPSTKDNQSTCKSLCDSGWTSNGSPLHECEKCDESCSTCMDNEEKGDIKKCTSCSKSHPFMFSPNSECMTECGVGYYQVNSETCDKCTNPCMDCGGDKFNCTLCDSTAPEKALFSQSVQIGDDFVTRGTCYRSCPNGYFMDFTNDTDIRCGDCTGSCSTCEGSATQCLSCNGENDLKYVFEFKCYEECPNKTAPDMSSLQCIGCAENCNKCGT